ncbi:MAG: ABC transporter permease [Acidobacteria bacterium]|nr:ABC transporter permease [Acidobacteriota bacterium]
MTARDRAPFLLRLAVRLLPDEVRAEVLGDLLEHWSREIGRRPRAARSLWLMRQPVAALLARLRFRHDGEGLILPASWVALGVSGLDLKLGIRMLVKHPWLTLVVVFALGVGIPASLTPHHLIDAVLDESPPFDRGDQVVGVVGRNQESGAQELLRLGDYESLRTRLTSFAFVGAALLRDVNVISPDGRAEGARGAEMSASSFALARVPPARGRVLTAADEVVGAPEVMVVGHDYWRSRLGSRPDVIGSTLRIGGVPTTIVGVMPEGFAMPSREQLWLPLRRRAIDHADGLGPAVWMYGRLAEGTSRGAAGAELAAVGIRHDVPDDRGRVRADAVAFSALSIGTPTGTLAAFLFIAQGVPFVLLLIACGNVAILLLARTANRSREFALRTALGAGRSRIVAQLFVETLVLALLATGVGLLGMHLIVERVTPGLDLPFWVDLGMTPEVVMKALALGVASAVLAGVLPALRATGSSPQRTLQGGGGGLGGFRFGRVTGALIIAEVGLGVGALFAAGMTYRMFAAIDQETSVAMQTSRVLVASIDVPSPERPGRDRDRIDETRIARIASMQEAIARELAARPEVRSWAFSDATPGDGRFERRGRVEGDGMPPGSPGLPVVTSQVEPGFFRTLGIEPLHGRTFEREDVPVEVEQAPTRVLVNTKFLDRRGMQYHSAVGQTMRISDPGEVPTGPWMEIIGVVPDLEASLGQAIFDGTPMAYLPAVPGGVHPLTLVIDLGDDPTVFAPVLRRLVADADPTAILSDVVALDQLPNTAALVQRSASGILVGLSLIAIVLSTTALYTLLSFTVARRTREIGVRIALGGRSSRIVASIARRPLHQLGAGVVLGAGFWGVVFTSLHAAGAFQGELGAALRSWPYVLSVTAAIVVATGLSACLAPILRGLRIRPVEALRIDA